MYSAYFLRRASSRALIVALSSFEISSCGAALAQQALPTIEIGRAAGRTTRAAPAPRSENATSAPAPRSENATPAPAPAAVASPRRLEPKTPTEAYVVRDAVTATKTDIPIRQTPASIQVVPKQVLTDQQVTNVKDALSNVSGVVSNNLDAVGAYFYLRGFRANYLFRNGLAIPQDETPTLVDTANIERIEVLKGPASVLYGRSEPGGIVNIVTKQPLDQPFFKVDQQIGSYDHYRTQWDFSSPVAEVPGLAYRVTGAYQNNGSFRQFQGGRRAMLAPVVRYSPTAWTEFTIDTQFLTSRIQNDLGLPTATNFWALPNLPRTRSYQEANDPKDINDYYNVGYTFRQNLTEDWKVTNRSLYTEGRWSSTQLTGAGVDPDFSTQNRLTQYQDLKSYNFATNIDLNGKFEALGARHNFLFGLDYLNNNYNYVYNNGFNNYPINLYAPIYGTVPTFAFYDSMIGSGFKFHSSVLTRQKGMYVQDHVTWFDRLHLLIGARYDIADVTRGTSSSFPIFDDNGNFVDYDYSASKNAAIANRLAARTQYFSGWTPRVGVMLDLMPELSGYASYTRAFGKPNNGFGENGLPLPPEKSQQWEIGLKAQPLPGLLATLSVFQITKSNVATDVFGGPQISRFAGLQRSRGVELDIIGALTDRMTVIANYAFTNAKVIADAPMNRLNPYGNLDEETYGPVGGFIGNHLPFAPRHTCKIFLTYDFGENGLGFRAGGGVTASSNWWGDLQNVIVMPSFARLDGFASYTTELDGHKVTAQLNLQNINNVRYFEAVDNQFNFYAPPLYRIPAQPFRAIGTISFRW